MNIFKNKKILLIICGGIAAYKSLEIIRLLKKKDAQVKTILTEALELRESYKSLKRYNENKSDVIKVKTSIKKFRSIQNYCLQNYKRAMFENNCDTKEILKNKQKSLFELGIQTAKY